MNVYIVVKGEHFDSVPVESGVPQGIRNTLPFSHFTLACIVTVRHNLLTAITSRVLSREIIEAQP